jgi:uncharacterized membrane protein
MNYLLWYLIGVIINYFLIYLFFSLTNSGVLWEDEEVLRFLFYGLIFPVFWFLIIVLNLGYIIIQKLKKLKGGSK